MIKKITYVFMTLLFSLSIFGQDVTRNSINDDGNDDLTINSSVDCSNSIMPNYFEDFTYYLPACWYEAKGDLGMEIPHYNRWTNDGFLNQGTTGAARIYIYGSDTHTNDWLISPSFDLSGGNNFTLSFKVGVSVFSNPGGAQMGQDDTVKLLVTTDDGATWTQLEEWNSTTDLTGGINVTKDISTYAGNANVKFAFYANAGATAQEGYNFYLDDFSISDISCPAPTQLNRTITGISSVILSWVDNSGGVASYLVEWKEMGTTSWNNATVPAGTTSYTLTGLTTDTEYVWRLTSDCGGGVTTTVNASDTFIPTCIEVIPDYLQEFTNYIDPCWKEGEGTMSSYTIANTYWTNDGFANNGSTGAARVRLYNNAMDYWLISPEFDLSGGNYTLELDVAITKFTGDYSSTMGADDQINIQASTDGGNTWSVLYTWTDANKPSNTGDHVSIPLNAFSGNTIFAIVASDGSVPELAYNFYVDNFAVLHTSTASRPTGMVKVYNVNLGQHDNVYRIKTDNHQKMLNVTAYDLTGNEIYKAMNVNAEEVESQINVKPGSLIIFRIEMPDHTIVTKKSIKR